MARGWESKSVEEQQADQSNRRAFESKPLTITEAEREALTLQRKRILLAIESSVNPRYISQQQEALAFLDRKLEQLVP